MWGLQVDTLRGMGPILAPDFPGFGAEPPLSPDERTPERYADWVAERLRAEGVRSCSALGYSMGGTLALLLTVRHPHLVRRLVAVCASPCWAMDWRRPVGKVLFDRFGSASVAAFRWSILRAFDRWSDDSTHRPMVEEMIRKAHAPTMLSLCRALVRADYRGLLPAIRVPTLVAGGSLDHLAPPSHLREFAAEVPGSELKVLKGGNHVLCLSRPVELSDLLSEFLNRTAPRAGEKERGDATS